MDAVSIMMNQKGKKGEKGVIDYWDDARKLLSDPNKFIKSLEKYDKDNIPDQTINKMKDFIGNKDFLLIINKFIKFDKIYFYFLRKKFKIIHALDDLKSQYGSRRPVQMVFSDL